MDRRVFVWAGCVYLALASSAEARKWVDVAGNQISADYVRIHEGEVILRQGKRIIKCPYDQFSELDKAYIREQMEAERTKSKSRAGLNQIGGPVAPESTDGDSREMRTWRDLQGKKILAQYTGFSRADVELIKDGKRVSYPYVAFSPADQAYVAQILIAEGRSDEIPKKKEASEGSSQDGGVGGESGYGSRGRMGGGPMGSGDAPPAPDYEVSSSRGSLGYGSGPDFEPPHSSGPPDFSPPMSHTSIEPPSFPSTPSPSSYSGSSGQQMTWVCSECNKDLPDSISAGDNCPHCGTYLSYQENADGTKEQAGQISWRNRRLVIRLGVLGLLALMGAAGALFRR